jgi:ADP-heptose:LPS heptosyltransferase
MDTNEFPWINPIGGLGDMLMLSGVLKQVIEKFPERRFNLTRRTNYVNFFEGHPAIATIGYPPKNAKIVSVNYWNMDNLAGDTHRAYQVLAKSFGLDIPVKEELFLHNPETDDSLLHNFIPWKNKNIAIAPSSDSPRKIMPADVWHRLVELLKFDGYFVFQLGRMKDLHIRNAYSLLGLTTPRQAVKIIERADVVITSDNFLMHAAKLVNKPAVVLWGATLKEIYGYEGHYHITAPRTCQIPASEECIDSNKNKSGSIYGTKCPMGADHCLAKIKADDIYILVKNIISGQV